MEEISMSTVAATATGATGDHLLKLEGYRRLKGLHGNGKSFDSCRFHAAGHAWKLRCYPNGRRKEDAGFFSLYLVHDDAAAINVEVELALVSPPAPPFSRSYTHSFRWQGAWRWGFAKFIREEELQRRGFLRDDCLVVRCTVTVVEVAAVKDGYGLVKAKGMLGVKQLCDCDDDGCKRRHRRRQEGLTKALLRFCL